MPLNWDATECDPKALEESELTMTRHFCFVLMDAGIPVLTEDNFEEAYERVKLGEALSQNWFIDRPLTLEDFELRVGYRTNVTPFTRNEYEKKVLKVYWEDRARLKRRVEQSNKKKEEVA